MSSNLPLRTIRIPALRPQQCLFQHRRSLQSPRAFSTSSPQAFAATYLRLRGGSTLGRPSKAMQKAAARSQTGPAPRVNEMKLQQEGAMAEDIGLLQDTLVRPSWRDLPMPISYKFWSFLWKLLKSKGTGLYSRSMYKRCIYKTGWKSYLPIDAWEKSHFQSLAATHYQQLYINFAKGDMSPIARFCLPPLLDSFKSRISSRNPVQMDWKLVSIPKARVMSHRASIFGEESPDSAYRQVVVRITSKQKLTIKPTTQGKTMKKGDEFWDNGKPETVVEYLVLQRRVISGVEDKEWKIWGFTQESTPQRIAVDEEYWRRTLNATAA